jgi:hypothetical protein
MTPVCVCTHTPHTPRAVCEHTHGLANLRTQTRQEEATLPEVWTLSFRAEGDGPPAELRVRALLKRALRSHGLRCVDYRLAPPAATASGQRAVVERTTK